MMRIEEAVPVVGAGSAGRRRTGADDVAFTQLYAHAWGDLVRLARVVLDDRTQAEEVVQDAFVAFYVRISTVDNPQAYMRVAVLNRARKANRRSRLTRRHLFAGQAAGASEDQPDQVLDAVHRLPRRRREVVVLRYYLDLSEAEIATVLGIPSGTVKSLAHRAMRQLQEVLRDD